MKIQKSNPYYDHAKSEADARQKARAVAEQGQTTLDDALDTAIRYRDSLQAKALLDLGANPNTKDINNASALGHAIASKNLESVDMLLTYGADPNLRTDLGTPLTLAIYEEQWDMMHRLLRSGADVNAIGTIRSTPLHIITKYARDPKLVKLLLEHGANVHARDAEGLTALDWAKREKNEPAIRLLQRAAGQTEANPKKRPGRKRQRRTGRPPGESQP
jgi:ankyrin repeat protein